MMTSRAILICFSLSFFFYLFSFSATEQLPFSPQTLQIRVRVVHYLPPGLTAKSDTSRCVWGHHGTLGCCCQVEEVISGSKAVTVIYFVHSVDSVL